MTNSSCIQVVPTYLCQVQFQLIRADKTAQVADEVFFGVWIASKPTLGLLQVLVMNLRKREDNRITEQPRVLLRTKEDPSHHTVRFWSDVVISVSGFEEHRRPYDANMLSSVLVNNITVFVQGYELVATVSATSQYVDVAMGSELTEVEESLGRTQNDE